MADLLHYTPPRPVTVYMDRGEIPNHVWNTFYDLEGYYYVDAETFEGGKAYSVWEDHSPWGHLNVVWVVQEMYKALGLDIQNAYAYTNIWDIWTLVGTVERRRGVSLYGLGSGV